MSLTVTRAGMLDTIQDRGRYGYQHLGINPGGAMDPFSASLANALLGKDLDAAVIEFHFPASEIRFNQAAIICLTGADFTPFVNDHPVLMGQPVRVPENSFLTFRHKVRGARTYLAAWPGLQVNPWLGSRSTNLKAAAGGLERALGKGDTIPFEVTTLKKTGTGMGFLPWKSSLPFPDKEGVDFLFGPEWQEMDQAAQTVFLNAEFEISNASDRMGYRLDGPVLRSKGAALLSSGAGFGTVQLLPNGRLIILMADHQTTGGYPRIAQVSTTDLPILAQKNPGDRIRFSMCSLAESQKRIGERENFLLQLKNTCNFKLEKFLNESV